MVFTLPDYDIDFDLTRPEGTQVMFSGIMLHVPTGTVVRGTGPSVYRLKTDLRDRLTKEVLNNG